MGAAAPIFFTPVVCLRKIYVDFSINICKSDIFFLSLPPSEDNGQR